MTKHVCVSGSLGCSIEVYRTLKRELQILESSLQGYVCGSQTYSSWRSYRVVSGEFAERSGKPAPTFTFSGDASAIACFRRARRAKTDHGHVSGGVWMSVAKTWPGRPCHKGHAKKRREEKRREGRFTTETGRHGQESTECLRNFGMGRRFLEQALTDLGCRPPSRTCANHS